MKITQETEFKPITIVLETRIEALNFIKAIDTYTAEDFEDADVASMCKTIANWFTNHSQL